MTFTLMLAFLAVVLGLPAYLPLQAASWLTFVALLITPGYFLTEIITWHLKLDWLERLTLAFPLGLAALALPGLIVVVLHLTIQELELGWILTVDLLLIAWLVHSRWRRTRARFQNCGWAWNEVVMLLLLAAIFVYIFPALSTYKIDGDAYTFLAFVNDALSGQPMNVTEPLFGTDLGPGVRVAFNQFLPLWALWAYLSQLHPVDFTATASRTMLALWTMLALYTLGKAAGGGRRRFGLFTVSIQMLIYLTAPFFRDDNVSNFFFENIHADKFTLSVVILPVVFAFSIRYLSDGRLAAWLVATIAAFAVSTVHPLIAVMLALALAAFGGLHLLLNFHSRTARGRIMTLAILVGIALIVPFLQFLMARSSTPLASTYPRSFEGWSIGEKMTPTLPFFQLESLDMVGPLPDLANMEAIQANADTNPFLLWRFGLNMRRQRLILFDLNHYISDPGLILEPPYLLCLLFTPLLLWQLRGHLGAQFALSTTLAVIFVMFNPVVTPLVGSLIVPWILWRIIWLLPYTLTIALVSERLLLAGARVLGSLVKYSLPQTALYTATPLSFILAAGLLLWPGIRLNVQELQYRAIGPRAYPTPRQILAFLDEETSRTGPVMVAAEQDLSVTIPAYVANANVIGHRIFNTSEIFPADQQAQALQRLIDQHTLFNTSLLTPTSLEILQRYNIRYVIITSGSDLDLQLRLSSRWFEWLMDDQSYSLYAIREMPGFTPSIYGNEALSQHQWEMAQQYYQSALQQDPSNLLALAGLAEAYRAQGQFDLALRTLQQTVLSFELPTLHYRLGQLYAEIGQLERSIIEFDQAQQAAPLVPPFHLALGDACLGVGQYQCAAQQYEVAVAIEDLPDEASRLLALADLWQQRGQTHPALMFYEQAVRLEPSKQNQLLLASVYQDLQLFDRAKALLHTLRRQNPLSAEVIFRMAQLMAAQNAIEPAINLYRQAIWLQALQIKDTTPTRLALAQFLLNVGYQAEAGREIEHTLSLQPHNPTAHILLGDLYRDQNQPSASIMAYQRALQLDPSQVAAFLALSNQYRHYTAPDQNLELLQTAVQINANQQVDPEQASLFLVMGDQLQQLGDLPGAITAYQSTLDLLEPDGLSSRLSFQTVKSRVASTYARLGTVYEELGKVSVAMNYYRAAAATEPTEPWSQVLLGDALRRRNDLAGAEAMYRQAIEIDATHVDAYTHLAELLRSQGDIIAAAALYDQALQAFSSDVVQELRPQAWLDLVNFYSQSHLSEPNLGSADEQPGVDTAPFGTVADPLTQHTLHLYIQALEVDKNLVTEQALIRLYQETGQSDEAIQLYQNWIQQGEKENLSPLILSRYYKGLGDIYLNHDHFNHAKQAYQQAIALNDWGAEAHLGLAQVLSEQGDDVGALRQIQTAVQLTPGSIEAQLALANILTQQGDKEQALTIYQAMTQAYPGNIKANLAMAQAWQARNRWLEAEQSYRQVITITPNNAEAVAGLATLYVAQARYVEAESLLRQAIQLDYSYAEAYLQLGKLMAHLGRYAEAIAIYEQALQIEPDNWRIYVELGKVNQRLGQLDEAIAHLKKAAVIEPLKAQPSIELASLFQEQNQPDQAEDILVLALSRSRDHAAVRYALADLYQSQGPNDQALTQLHLAVQENPNSMEALVRYADELRRQDHQSEAEILYQQVEQMGELNTVSYRSLAALYQDQGRLNDALTLLEQALTLEPGEVANWLRKGQLLAQQGQQDAAFDAFQRASQLAPADGQIWYTFGEALLANGQTKEALNALERALAVEPTYLPSYGLLLEIYQTLDQFESAAHFIALARKVAPGNYLVDIYTARLWQEQQAWQEARAALDQARRKAPGNPDPLVALGDLAQLQSNVEQAKLWYEQALDLRPGDAQAHLRLIDLLLRRGKNDQALIQAEKAIAASPYNNEVVLRLGIGQRTLGHVSDAETTLLKAAHLDPIDSRPYAELATLYLAHGQPQAAMTAYQQAIALEPKETAYYAALSQVLQDLAQSDQALVVLQDGLTHASEPTTLYSALAALYLQRGEAQLAFETLDQARQQHGDDSELLLALGEYHRSQAEFDQAQAIYEHLLALKPQDTTSHLTLAGFHLDRGRVSEAFEHYEQAALLEPTNAEAHLALGNAYRLTNQISEATVAYNRGLTLDPTLAQGYLSLATLYQDQAQWTKAQSVYERGLAMIPLSGPLLRQYSDFLQKRGARDQALAMLDQAVQQAPGVEPFLARAELYRRLGRLADAEADLLAAIGMAPGAVEPRLALGNLFQAQGDVSNATEAYRTAIAIAPGVATGYLRLAQMTYLQGNLNEVWYYFNLALAREPASVAVLLSLAETRRDQGDITAAEQAYRRIIAVAPLTSQAYIGLATITQQRSADLAEALTWLEQAAQWSVELDVVNQAIATLYREAGQSEMAFQYFQQALVLKPGLVSSYLALSDYYLAQGRPQAAESYARQALEISPSDPAAYIALGTAQYSLGGVITAQQSYQTAIDLDVSQINSHLALAKLYQHQEQPVEAIETYRQALQRAPLNGSLLLLMHDVYVAMGDPHEALSVLDQALALNPNAVEAWLRRGNLHLGQGDTAAALAAFKQAQRLRPEDAEPIFHIAMLHKQQNNTSEAEGFASKALSLDPQHAPAYALLGDILSERDETDTTATQNYLRAVQIDPRQLGAYPDWIRLHIDRIQGRTLVIDTYRLETALTSIERGSDANTVWGQVMLALGYSRLEKPTEHVLKYLEAASVLDPEFIGLYEPLALAYEAQSDLQRALETWRRYLYATRARYADTGEIEANIARLQAVSE